MQCFYPFRIQNRRHKMNQTQRAGLALIVLACCGLTIFAVASFTDRNVPMWMEVVDFCMLILGFIFLVGNWKSK